VAPVGLSAGVTLKLAQLLKHGTLECGGLIDLLAQL
jgi:hypothetical protein